MWPFIVVGILAVGATAAYLDSKKLRVGDNAIVPLGALSPTTAKEINFRQGLEGVSTLVLVTKINGTVIEGVVNFNFSGAQLPMMQSTGATVPVTFSLSAIQSFTRNGKQV